MPRRNLIAPKSKLVASAKLSDYRIKKIIRDYAYAVPAADAARGMKVSYQTIRHMYCLIRQRMVELGLYALLSEEEDTALSRTFRRYNRVAARSPLQVFLRERLGLRRGALKWGVENHWAELKFWYSKPDGWSVARYAERHRIDIIKLIQLSGPINRPVSEERKLTARAYLDQRQTALKTQTSR